MVHRCEHLLFTSQLWLPYLAFCFDPSECFQDLCVWSRAVGNKSSKLQYMLWIMTLTKTQTCSDLLATLLINMSVCLSRHQNCSSDAITNTASRPPLSFGVQGVTLAIQVDDASPSIQVLWKHQIVCSDTLSGTVNH